MPRKILGAAFISLDGVIQGPGGPDEDTSGGFAYSGWMAGMDDDAIGERIGRLFDAPFDLLLGRRTYDIFAAYWPYASPDYPITQAFAKCAKFVLTHSDAPLTWQHSHRVADLDALAALKATDGPDLVIQGSSTLYPQLLERGLLDRLTLMIFPVTLGAGKRLFGDGTPGGMLKLVEHLITPSGTIVADYEPAGPVRIGSFVDQEPSQDELARRAKIAQGTW